MLKMEYFFVKFWRSRSHPYGNGVRHTKTRTANNTNVKGRSKSLASSLIE